MQLHNLSWRERGQLWLRLGIRIVLTVGALLLLFFAVPPLLSLLMPFVLAFFMAWLLNPLIRRLQEKLKISRKLLSLLLIILVFAVAGGALGWFLYSIGAEVYSIVSSWEAVGTAAADGLNALGEHFSKLFALLPQPVTTWIDGVYEQLLLWLNDVVPTVLTSLGRWAGNFAISVPSWAVAAVVFIMASYFVTADYPRLRLLVTGHVSEEVRQFFRQVKAVATAAFGGYVKAEFILSVVVFFILLIGFTLMGQGYALLLSFLLAVMDFIPIIGAGTAMVPWAAAALITGDYRTALELMVVWGVIVLFRRLAEPKVVGDQTGLSPVLSLVSIYVGMRLGGVLGMVLGPVVFLIVINIGKLGVLDGVLSDVRLAVGDIRALLAAGRQPPRDGTSPGE